jgi:hypothetical protein
MLQGRYMKMVSAVSLDGFYKHPDGGSVSGMK